MARTYNFCHKDNLDQMVHVAICQKRACEHLQYDLTCDCKPGFHYVNAWAKIRKDRKGE